MRKIIVAVVMAMALTSCSGGSDDGGTIGGVGEFELDQETKDQITKDVNKEFDQNMKELDQSMKELEVSMAELDAMEPIEIDIPEFEPIDLPPPPKI